MDRLWVRWGMAVICASVAFIGCWAALFLVAKLDNAVALGWAVLPLTIIVALGGVWADKVRRDAAVNSGAKAPVSQEDKSSKIVQKQKAGDNSRQFQVGGNVNVERRDD